MHTVNPFEVMFGQGLWSSMGENMFWRLHLYLAELLKVVVSNLQISSTSHLSWLCEYMLEPAHLGTKTYQLLTQRR